MNICLIRHADAVQVPEGSAMEDADRPLTDRGRDECRALAECFQRRGIALGKIAVSPLVRATQTADELLAHWEGDKPEIHVCKSLAPDGKFRRLTRFIRGLESETVTLIGHQ